MKTSELSFLSCAEKLTLGTYQLPRKYSIIASEVLSRLAAVILLSPAAGLDLAFHGLLVLPTFVYAIGKSNYQRQIDFTLPWQHIQRIRNAVAPLLLSSVFGLLHPFAGLVISEATDKHAVIGMLSSNTKQDFETPCSPIHSLSIVENIAKNHRYAESNGVKKEIFSEEHINVLKDARNLEESLEVLQAQEFIHKITNVTLFVMATIKINIETSRLSELSKAILVRVSGILVPILTTVDITITLLAQAFFLATGISRLISGRGPIYTEVTTNPLMHVSFLIQNILKSVGNLLGTVVWFVSPITGFKVSLLPANLFFKLQMNILMMQIKWKMHFSKDNNRFVIPIIFGNGDCSALSVPTHSMHKTYLIVEKKVGSFNLYWVNRPNISYKHGLNKNETLAQIHSMLDERFPFMNIEKLINYPVKSQQPVFSGSANYGNIAAQGSWTNCVVSNMFGMLEALDRINGEQQEITNLRYKAVREVLMKDYGFYKNNFFPFANESYGYSLENIWNVIESHPNDPI
jgi:succinate dehydrogenase/fumarate reductase cytochrome b subunit